MRAGVFVAIALAAPAAAVAEPAGEAVLEVELSEPPQIRAQLIGARHVTADKIKLVDAHGVAVQATSLRSFRDGPETIAIAFVIASGEIWMGNDDFEAADSPTRYPGVLRALKDGLGRLDLARALPPGSVGTIVTYDERVRTIAPLGPIAKLQPAMLGTQKDYYGRIGNNLVQGIEAALDALQGAATSKKLVFVIGDGNDTDADRAPVELASLKKRAAMENVAVEAIVYKTPISDDRTAILRLAPHARIVATADGVAAAMRTIVQRVASRYQYATFPAAQLRWDGTPQELTIEVGDDRLDPVVLTLGVRAAPPRYGWWLLQIGLGLALVGTIGLLMRWRAARRSWS